MLMNSELGNIGHRLFVPNLITDKLFVVTLKVN